jgi:hypothetical protein
LFPNYFIENSEGGQENLNKFSHPNDSKGKNSLIGKTNFWYGRNFQVEFICPMARRMPSDSMADGPKWVRYVVYTHGSGRMNGTKSVCRTLTFEFRARIHNSLLDSICLLFLPTFISLWYLGV